MRIFLFLILLSCSVILSAQKRITLFFAGDLMQHQAQIDSAYNEGTYDYSDCFSAVKPLVSKPTSPFANLEVTLGGETVSGIPSFLGPRCILYAIKECSFRHSAHSQQSLSRRGKKGLDRTLSMLDSLLHSA